MSRQRRQDRLDTGYASGERRHDAASPPVDEAQRDHPDLPAAANASAELGDSGDGSLAAPDRDLATGSIVWVHGDCLRPTNPALVAAPDRPALFVFDDALLGETAVTLKRLVFLYECLLEIPVVIRRGDVAAGVIAIAREHGAERVLTTPSPAPRFAPIRDAIAGDVRVEIVPEVPFLAFTGHLDLRRFGRYWRTAQRYAYGQAGLPVEEWERQSDAATGRPAQPAPLRLPGPDEA